MNVYCIGIGGIGISYAARLLVAEGHSVTGADASESTTTKELRAEGIQIFIGHTAQQIPEDCDLVLISPAILSNKTEDYFEAEKRNIHMTTWQEYIGEWTGQKNTIAICGAHGKSTTTAMVGLLLVEAGLDPTVLIGTKLKEFGGKNIRIGKSDWVVIEADEFNDNFLAYHPAYIILTNYELDHLDYFKTEERYRSAFINFFHKLSPQGKVFYHPWQNDVEILVAESKVTGIPVPRETHFTLSIPGKHNRENASLVEALGHELHISDEVIRHALQSFHGTWRRQELKGVTVQGALVYDDYAHHPTEVKATLAAMRELYPHKYIVCVFQPHQFSRTKIFLEAFSRSFSDADTVIIAPIYESRDTEEDKKTMSSEILVREIEKKHPHVVLGDSLDILLEQLQHADVNNENTVIVVMGAGSITTLATKLVAL